MLWKFFVVVVVTPCKGYNEPGVGDVASMTWLAEFEVARIGLLRTAGFKAAIGSFSTGTPDVTDSTLIQAFYPAIDAALAAGGILGVSSFGCFILLPVTHQGSSPSCTSTRVQTCRLFIPGRWRAAVVRAELVLGPPRPSPLSLSLVPGWLTGRYRKLYQNYLSPSGRGTLRLAITGSLLSTPPTY